MPQQPRPVGRRRQRRQGWARPTCPSKQRTRTCAAVMAARVPPQAPATTPVLRLASPTKRPIKHALKHTAVHLGRSLRTLPGQLLPATARAPARRTRCTNGAC